MDLSLLLAGILQLILSLIIGLAFIYAGFRFFYNRIKTIDEISELKKNNIAVAVLNGSIILSLIIMVKNAIEPAITTFTLTLRNPESTLTKFLETAGIMLIQIIVASTIAFITIFIALSLYTYLTRDLDEIEEIKNNNIAVSIVLGVVIISISLLMQQGIKSILDALIPFPSVSLKDIGL
ncbi:MAG: DUF350 domain-containing protein [Ignavibacteriaceae bacterium]|jgi:uncharacterized membrane protein YjfL (UPF0719 family)|nr:DUF350 domain-containing protein [Ignavibacteriaceae bacterium]